MFSHIMIGANNIEESKAFYDAVLGALGHERFQDYEDFAAAYGKPQDTVVWVVSPLNQQPASAGNGITVGFLAPDRGSVDAFHAAALEHGPVVELVRFL